MNPFRLFYSSLNVITPRVWSSVLAKITPLPQPRASVKFHSPLRGCLTLSSTSRPTLTSLRDTGLDTCLLSYQAFDNTVAARPLLAVSEWHDALWGDYEVNEVAQSLLQPQGGRWKVRRQLEANIRQPFGQGQSLPLYCVDSQPLSGNSVVTHVAAVSDCHIHHRMVWETIESNWRCELLALDAVTLGSNEWTEILR